MSAVLMLLLKYATGPVVVQVIRMLMPLMVKAVPAWIQPLAAALINSIVSLMSGTAAIDTLPALLDAIKVFLETGGLVKLLDMLKGKSNTVTPAQKETLDKVLAGIKYA